MMEVNRLSMKKLNVPHFLGRLFRRRKTTLLGTFFLIAFFSAFMALSLPPKYESRVRFVIDAQPLPPADLRRGTHYIKERIEKRSRQALCPTNLLRIIEEQGLYKELKGSHSNEAPVAVLRNNIRIVPVPAADASGQIIPMGFDLSYAGRTPGKVQRVAAALAQLFLEQEAVEIGMPQVDADFLREELRAAAEQRASSAHRRMAYRKVHISALSESTADGIAAVKRLENEYERITTDLRSLEEKKAMLDKRLSHTAPPGPSTDDGSVAATPPTDRLKRLRVELIRKQAIYSRKHPDIIRMQKEITWLEDQIGHQDISHAKVQRLADLEMQLAALRKKLGEKHPDVIKAIREHEALLREVDSLMTAQIAFELSGPRTEDPGRQAIKTRIAAIDAQISLHRDALERLNNKISDHRKMMANRRQHEKEYTALTRQYDADTRRYNDLTRQLIQASLIQEKTATEQATRFIISHPAVYPKRPYSPNRSRILLIGMLLAAGTSIALAALLEAMDASLKSPKEIAACTGLPVFCVLPLFQTKEEKQRLKRRNRGIACAFIFLLFLFIAFADRLFPPVSALWTESIHRLAGEKISLVFHKPAQNRDHAH